MWNGVNMEEKNYYWLNLDNEKKNANNIVDYNCISKYHSPYSGKIDEIICYNPYTPTGRKRPNFKSLKTSDGILGFVISPQKKVKYLLEFIERENQRVFFKIKKIFKNPVSFKSLTYKKEFKDSELIRRNYEGKCLFKLSQIQFEIIQNLTNINENLDIHSDLAIKTIEETQGQIDENYIPFSEGQKKVIQSISYERNPKNRKKALKIHGTTCLACGFNFNDFYGEDLARDFIEVHHIKPISKGVQEINPKTDLIPVCSNCHSMIHRESESLTSFDKIVNRYRK